MGKMTVMKEQARVISWRPCVSHSNGPNCVMSEIMHANESSYNKFVQVSSSCPWSQHESCTFLAAAASIR